MVAEASAAAGMPAASLDGTTRERDRASVLERFQAGAIKVLASCDLLTEGFDAPEAAVALLLRPTHSLALHRQMIGRVLRSKSDGGAALLLDYGGNLIEHGLPDTPVAWSLAGRGGVKDEPPAPSAGPAPRAARSWRRRSAPARSAGKSSGTRRRARSRASIRAS